MYNNTLTKNQTSLDLERPKLLIKRYVASAENTKNQQRETLRTAPPSYALDSVRKSSAYIKPHAKTKDTLRERLIKEWAFKKIDINDIFKSNDLLKSEKSFRTRLNNEFWIDDINSVSNSLKSKIDLSEYDDPEADAEFYRKHRNSGMYKNKADAEKNILLKMLDSKLLDLSKDRFKLISYVDYQKKTFVKNQLLKSKSLPGLKCLALEMNKTKDHFEEYKSGNVSGRKKKDAMLELRRKKSSIKQTNLKNIRFRIQNENLNLNSDDENTQLDFSQNKMTKNGLNVNNLNLPVAINPSSKKLSINFLENSNNSFENRKMMKKDSIYRLSYRNSLRQDILTDRSDQSTEKTLSNRQPVIDNRFDSLISVIKPSYFHKEMKDVSNIIDKNEALKTINLNAEVREKMKKVKNNGVKLAEKARKIISSGEYIQ